MVAAMFFMIGSAISFRSRKEREEASGSFGGLTVYRPPFTRKVPLPSPGFVEPSGSYEPAGP
jgi:hypothetical protein